MSKILGINDDRWTFSKSRGMFYRRSKGVDLGKTGVNGEDHGPD